MKFSCPLKHFNKQTIMCLISNSPSEPERHQRKIWANSKFKFTLLSRI